MRLREFELDYGSGSNAAVSTMINFLKKQSAKKGVDGQISKASLDNLMTMSKFGGANIDAYLQKLQRAGVITDYDDENIYFADGNDPFAMGDMPLDDPMGAEMDPLAGGPDDLGMGPQPPGDPMAAQMGGPAPSGITAPAATNTMTQDPGMMMAPPDPVEGMAKRALARRS